LWREARWVLIASARSGPPGWGVARTTNRHRLDRGGNRQINATIHRIAVTRLRCYPETQDYIARKRAEGKSTKEAIRCLKRHLTRRLWHLLVEAAPPRAGQPHPSTS
jgi:transposase